MIDRLERDRIATLFAESEEAILLAVDGDGQVLDASPAARRMWPGAASLAEIVPLDPGLVAQVLASGQPRKGPASLLRPDSPPLEGRFHVLAEGAGRACVHLEVSLESLLAMQAELGAINSELTNLHRERVKQNRRLNEALQAIEAQSEELQAQNEELQTQAEEIEAQADEIMRSHAEAAELNANNHELHRLNELTNQFVGIISHELKTPLNFITGFGSLLAEDVLGPLNDRQGQAVSRIMVGASRLETLIQELLDANKIQAGKLDVRPVSVPYGPVLQVIAEEMAPGAAAKGLRFEVPDGLDAVVLADPARLHQVLRNLLSNAFKFTPEGGFVTVTVGHESPCLAVPAGFIATTVRDSGIGIPASALPHLFQPFYQVDSSSTRAYGGTGLGLSIVRSLVEAMGGHVGVSSEPGVGSCFAFTLPVAPSAGKAP